MSGCEAWFYHLERSGVDEVLPELLEKTLARGWKAIVRAPGPQRLEALDAHLWTYRDDSFLPHGLAHEPGTERQPILLGSEPGSNPNEAQALFLVEASEAGPLDGFERCVVLFDGGDPAQLERARGHWKFVVGSGMEASYWRQTEAGWRIITKSSGRKQS